MARISAYMKAQGATEYLVLLAVVLIIALVSIALLGFFPGMSADTKLVQSQTYWKSAYPIAITEWGAKAHSIDMYGTVPYFLLVNQGGNPIKITNIFSGNNSVGSQTSGIPIPNPKCYGNSGLQNLSDTIGFIAPGQSIIFGWGLVYPGASSQANCTIFIKGGYDGMTGELDVLYGASSICDSEDLGTGTYGTLVVNDFGFEYVEIVEGHEITNRQFGKTLMIKCQRCIDC